MSFGINQPLNLPPGQQVFCLAQNKATKFLMEVKKVSLSTNKIVAVIPQTVELMTNRLFDRYVVDHHQINLKVTYKNSTFKGVLNNISVDGIRAILYDFDLEVDEDFDFVQINGLGHIKLVPPVPGKIMNWNFNSINRQILIGVYIENDYPFYEIKKHLNLSHHDIQ